MNATRRTSSTQKTACGWRWYADTGHMWLSVPSTAPCSACERETLVARARGGQDRDGRGTVATAQVGKNEQDPHAPRRSLGCD